MEAFLHLLSQTRFNVDSQVIWCRNSEDWDENPTTARGLIFELNMAEARLELVGST